MKTTIIAFSLAIVALTACGGSVAKGSATGVNADSDSVASLPQEVTMAFMGDVMMGTNVPSPIYVTKDRGQSLFKDCKQYISAADIAVANLEGTCYDGEEGEQRKMTNPRTYFIFRMPGDHAKVLAEAGVDVVNCANNHSFDFGPTGRKNTLRTIREAGIECTGLKDVAENCVVERNGVKFGYVSFAASCTKVLDMLNYDEILAQLKKLRPQCDVLMVGFHGGAEGTDRMHVPFKEEYYVGEDRGDVHKFAHFCIDNGADIVVGHGPHVPRAVELYKGHLIAYSLGNFCAPYRMGSAAQTGHAPLLLTTINPQTGEFLCGQIHSYRQIHGEGPRTDSENLAAKDIRTLTQQDFPETKLTIDETGTITKKQL